jgi:hypothetical protein
VSAFLTPALAFSAFETAVIAVGVAIAALTFVFVILALMSVFNLDAHEITTRTQVWIGVNIAAAAILLLLLETGDIGLYLWFVRRTWLGVLLFAAGLPVSLVLMVHAFESKRAYFATVWLAFAAVILIGIGNEALNDAQHLRYENCWRLNGATWACAPGTKPHEVSSETATRTCELIRHGAEGTTIWRCIEVAG